MERRTVKDGDLVTYSGNCDVVRSAATYTWREFGGDGKELIIGKQYPKVSSMCAQTVWIKRDGEFVKDNSGERYLYWKILNEQGEKIYVWEAFFEENTKL